MRTLLAIAKALSDEHRVRALMSLRGGELCLCQVIEMLGLAPSTVSKHMAILRQAGLVASRKDGRWIFFRLADKDALPAVREATRWVQNSLRDDRQIMEDARRLKAVRKMSTEALCACYHRTRDGTRTFTEELARASAKEKTGA